MYNQKSKDLLVKKLESEDFNRTTCSFYKYVTIVDPITFRDKIYEEFDNLEILGRVYIAEEGINAQISVCLLYTSPSPRDGLLSRMPSSA